MRRVVSSVLTTPREALPQTDEHVRSGSASLVTLRLGQDLDRDVAVQPGVPRSIDFAHSAAAEQVQQQKHAEAGAGCEGQDRSLRSRFSFIPPIRSQVTSAQ